MIGAASMYARGEEHIPDPTVPGDLPRGTGAGIVVGVFDTGAAVHHPDLDYVYDYSVGSLSVHPGGPDPHGHGTHVAGIIAARRDGVVMHGVAPDARIASYRVFGATRGGKFAAELPGGDRRMAQAVDRLLDPDDDLPDVYVVNHSYGPNAWSEHAYRPGFAADYRARFGQWLEAFRRHVAAGGVHVWAAGNSRGDYPAPFEVHEHAGLPYAFEDLKKGWLAVVAVGLDGEAPERARYSGRCGRAAEWCLAAPGGTYLDVYSTWPYGGYRYLHGTSMAAPVVTGAVAALKSLFPTLSYQEIRDRILYTADDSGWYANQAVYGQGLLDLDEASRPQDGTSLALADSDHGPVISTDGASVHLPPGALGFSVEDHNVLVLDNYQRASFHIPLEQFLAPSAGYLTLRDLSLEPVTRLESESAGSTTLAISGSDFQVSGSSRGTRSFAAGSGAAVMDGFARFAGVSTPHADYAMSQAALGFTLGRQSPYGPVYLAAASDLGSDFDPSHVPASGVAGWAPRSLVSASLIPDAFPDVSVGLSYASGLRRPSAWEGGGAYSLSGDSLALGLARSFDPAPAVSLDVTGRLSALRPDPQTSMVSMDNALVAGVGFDATVGLTDHLTVGARVSMERPLSDGEARARLPMIIDPDGGTIAAGHLFVEHGGLLSLDRAGIDIQYSPSPHAQYGAGVLVVQDGFREIATVAGVRAAFQF